MEGENKETKITSVEKERVKDPRRIEQGVILRYSFTTICMQSCRADVLF